MAASRDGCKELHTYAGPSVNRMQLAYLLGSFLIASDLRNDSEEYWRLGRGSYTSKAIPISARAYSV